MKELLKRDPSLREKLIATPIRLIFSADGINYFMRKNQKLNRFKLSNDTEELGIELVKFSPPTVQKMLLLGYLSVVDMTIEDVRKVRKDVIDVAKLISFGMFYLQFDMDVWAEIAKSDLIRKWNRRNPRNPIDRESPINAPFLQTAIDSRLDALSIIRQRILQPVFARIRKDGSVPAQEMAMQVFLANKFLDNLAPLSWLILSTNGLTDSNSEMYGRISGLLHIMMERSRVCEYIAMLIIELIMFLENSAKGAIKAEATGEGGLSVLWKIRPRRNFPNDRSRFTIVICDRKAVHRELGAKIYARANFQVNKKSLNELYEEAEGLDGEKLSLGLYYIAYLKEACNRLDIGFDSFVNEGPEGSTFVNLVFTY